MNILPVCGQSSAGTLTAQSFLPFVRTPEDANFPVPRCGQVAAECFYCAPERVSIIATGGLSHDPAEVGHGFIDTVFDDLFIKRMNEGNLDALGAYTDQDLLTAGAGTLELLAWICLAGIMGGTRSRLVCYEPVKPWATGVGIVSYAA